MRWRSVTFLVSAGSRDTDVRDCWIEGSGNVVSTKYSVLVDNVDTVEDPDDEERDSCSGWGPSSTGGAVNAMR